MKRERQCVKCGRDDWEQRSNGYFRCRLCHIEAESARYLDKHYNDPEFQEKEKKWKQAQYLRKKEKRKNEKSRQLPPAAG